MRRAEDRVFAEGYVFLVALFVILVLMTAALLVAAALHRQHRLYRYERQNVALMAIADGALAKALAQLWRDPDYGGTTEPFADGAFSIETRRLNSLTVEVTVRATYWNGARAARATVRIDRSPPHRRKPPRVLVWEPIAPR